MYLAWTYTTLLLTLYAMIAFTSALPVVSSIQTLSPSALASKLRSACSSFSDAVVVAAVYIKRVEDEHHAHMEHLKHERGDEPLPEYSYMNKRQKPFPWGMNTLFFNPEVRSIQQR